MHRVIEQDMSEKLSYAAPALEKGVRIIEHLGDSDIPLTMGEIAAALGHSKNEIYRMLVSLERLGWIERAPDEKYRLTNRLFDIAMRTPPLRNLHDAALPIMHRLSDEISQSCHLSIASSADIVVVARVESPGLLGFAVRLGYRRPIIHATSGRILFAFASHARQQAILEAADAAQTSSEDRRRFLSDSDRARKSGLCVASSAYVDGITDLSAPIMDPSGAEVIAALTVPYLGGRTARTSVEDAKQSVVAAAREVSAILALG